MRVGFVAASLAAHLGVVGLALYAASTAPRAATKPSVTALESGLVSVELSGAEARESQNAAQSKQYVGARSSVPSEETSKSAGVRTVEGQVNTESNTLRSALHSSTPRLQQKKLRTSERTSKPSGGDQGLSKSNQVTETRDDWLSIDQQLPVPTATQKVVDAPQRDELVERLLSKERERHRVKQREEQARSEVIRRREAPPEAVVATPHEAAAGVSHHSADPWVELTRWLPRAASSDRVWEQLPDDTHWDVQVLVRAAVNASVEVIPVGPVPDVVSRLLKTTAHMMQRGQFAAPSTAHRFALRIRLSQTPERELWIAHTTPDPPKPGVGTFVSPSGRRFDVWVAAEP